MSAIIYAISGTELFFTAVKSLLLGANRACLKALAVVSFLIESVAGMALTELLLLNAWGLALKNLSGIGAWILILVITKVLSILTEGHSIWAKLNGKDEDGGRGDRRRRTVIKWFSLTSGLATLSYALYDSIPGLYRKSPFVEIVVVVVMVQMLVIGLGSLLWSGKFVLRISIALVILVVDLCFGAVVLASGGVHSDYCSSFSTESTEGDIVIAEPSSSPLCDDYLVETRVAVAAFVLAIASAMTTVSAFRLVGYKARGDVAHDQVQFIETVVLSSVGPFTVIAMTEGFSAAPVLVTILPQMAVHLSPLLFEYLLGMPCGCFR